MKKLMMALAVGMCAVCANAAIVDWGYSITGAPKEGAAGFVDYTDGYTAYLLAAADFTDGMKLDDMQKAALDSSAIGLQGSARSGNTYNTKLPDGTVGQRSIEGASYVKDSAYDFTVVLVNDADKTYVATTKSMTARDDQGSAVIGNTPTIAQSTIADKSAWKSFGGDTPEPTPEPTSAMLLLLGVAGLALRRKQA